MIRKIVITIGLVLTLGLAATAQRVALKHNFAYDAILTPNLSLEFALGKKFTFDTQVGWNSYIFNLDASSPNYSETKWAHWMAQPELRYWFCDVFNGWFLGLHGHVGQMNVGGLNIPYPLILENKESIMKDHRYEGWFYGGGLSVGYQWVLSTRSSLEFSLGAGYARINYDKFPCQRCGTKVDEGNANYVGPTKATISYVFFFK